MKLKLARVTDFRSVEDSGEFKIGDLTCFVGKNEAGKTALLSALYGLNPYGAFAYDKTRDYPRRFVNKFEERCNGTESTVIDTTWDLDDADVKAVVDVFGEKALQSREVHVKYGIGYKEKTWVVSVNEAECLAFLVRTHTTDDTERIVVKDCANAKQAITAIEAVAQRSAGLDALHAKLMTYGNNDFCVAVSDILAPRMPKLFLTSHFERMSGEVSINALNQARTNNLLTSSDRIFLDFLEYAGTSVEELQASTKLEELKAKCEGASNEITDEIFEFWTQNDALQVVIDIAEGRPGDPPPFNAGTVVTARIHNSNHRVTVPLSERSAGFIWFFSFLAQFKQLRKVAGNAIILLDEPGLTLHGKAQADLLRYIEKRLLPTHQVIYSTHSPFMVPSDRLSDVLIVEDVVKRDEKNRPIVEGTKVRDDVLSVDKDTLFPLQGALGYDMTQSLFVGKNTLLVEGPSDILYLQALSAALQQRKDSGLNPRWTMCPSGGIDKIAPFASLFGANRLNIAALCDVATGDKAKIDRLRKSKILEAGHVFTIADFTGQDESDVEDLFPPAKYAQLLNAAYGLSGDNEITVDKLEQAAPSTQRVVKRAEAAFRVLPADIPEFDHFTPSSWLIRNPSFLDGEDADTLALLERAKKLFTTFNALLSES